MVADASINKLVAGAHKKESKSATLDVMVNALMELLHTFCVGVMVKAGGGVITAVTAVRAD